MIFKCKILEHLFPTHLAFFYHNEIIQLFLLPDFGCDFGVFVLVFLPKIRESFSIL